MKVEIYSQRRINISTEKLNQIFESALSTFLTAALSFRNSPPVIENAC